MPRHHKKQYIGILCSDFHLSSKPPVWRSIEPNWLEAMQRPLDEIKYLSTQFECPVLGAGDIFHHWNSPPSLINWTIEHLPCPLYAIPGQHDLPHHEYDLMSSAYGTLMKCGVLHNLYYTSPLTVGNLVLFGFPYGIDIQPCPTQTKGQKLNVALMHEYKWVTGCSYPDAPKNARMHSAKLIDNKWMGYDVVVCGDNHMGFQIQMGETTFFNCGGLMRRHSDDTYQPQVGLLAEDGSVTPHLLNITYDIHIQPYVTAEPKTDPHMEELMKELGSLGNLGVGFMETMEMYFQTNSTSKDIQTIIRKAAGADNE